MIFERPSPYPCPHRSARRRAISAIVIHDTGGHTAEGALVWFSKPISRVSSHVVIDRDGTIWRVVPDTEKAWHAGVSHLGGERNVNDFSLGVELVDHDKTRDFVYQPSQLLAAAEWCAQACTRYGISLHRIVGHDMIAPGRKVDPGADFPWSEFFIQIAHFQARDPDEGS